MHLSTRHVPWGPQLPNVDSAELDLMQCPSRLEDGDVLVSRFIATMDEKETSVIFKNASLDIRKLD